MPGQVWNENKTYKCRKCSSNDVEVIVKGKKTGVFCSKCGAWIKWLTYEEIKVFYKNFKTIESNAGKAFKMVSKQRNGTTIVKCSKCYTHLYNNKSYVPIGQFNLMDAKYCPKCGMEFMF